MKVEIDVDVWEVLDEIPTDYLEEALKKRRQEERPHRVKDAADVLIEHIDHDCLETAMWHWSMRRTDDALHFLERALGEDFFGLGDVAQRRAA